MSSTCHCQVYLCLPACCAGSPLPFACHLWPCSPSHCLPPRTTVTPLVYYTNCLFITPSCFWNVFRFCCFFPLFFFNSLLFSQSHWGLENGLNVTEEKEKKKKKHKDVANPPNLTVPQTYAGGAPSYCPLSLCSLDSVEVRLRATWRQGLRCLILVVSFI